MSRTVSTGTPGPVCHAGLGIPPVHSISFDDTTIDVAQLLGPPPPALRSKPLLATPDAQPATFPLFAQESFQVISGMYDLAEDCPEPFVMFQYRAALLKSLKSVPPTATLNGVVAVPSTYKPFRAAVSVVGSSHPAEPESPAAISIVMP